MSSPAASLAPQRLWLHFECLSAIPRPSKGEEAAAAYVLEQAERLSLEAHRDAIGNVLVRKPARPGREQAPTVALQGHLDMVCEKQESSHHDFEQDPIRFYQDGAWIRAEGTTLGADNGIGVAAGLALMEAEDVAHGPLELLFTLDEETGMSGALGLEPGTLKAAYLLNLDGEDPRQLLIGCAGGVDSVLERSIVWTPAPEGGQALRLSLSGLKGGHSGVDIHLGRGNALKLLGQCLASLKQRFDLKLADLHGGSVLNAIPRDASAILWVPSTEVPALQEAVARWNHTFQTALGTVDPNLECTLMPSDEHLSVLLEDEDASRLLDLLAVIPHGTLSMSPGIPGLVQTSTNLARVEIQEDLMRVSTSQRSSVAGELDIAAATMDALGRLSGFQVTHANAYPGWNPNPKTPLVQLITSVHQDLFGEPCELHAIHAGLECGVLGEKHPGLQMASFGPEILDAHSPSERVSIPSVERFWKLLVAVLERV